MIGMSVMRKAVSRIVATMWGSTFMPTALKYWSAGVNPGKNVAFGLKLRRVIDSSQLRDMQLRQINEDVGTRLVSVWSKRAEQEQVSKTHCRTECSD